MDTGAGSTSVTTVLLGRLCGPSPVVNSTSAVLLICCAAAVAGSKAAVNAHASSRTAARPTILAWRSAAFTRQALPIPPGTAPGGSWDWWSRHPAGDHAGRFRDAIRE